MRGSAHRVLLLGVPRSGSTWLGNVLGRAAGARPVYEPDGPLSDVLGAMVATRLGPYPELQAGERSGWYRLVWDLAFAGGWPWDQVEQARQAGRSLVRVPPAVRDALVATLAAGTARLRPAPGTVVVKSVNAAFSAAWLAERYDPQVVVLRREPLDIVSSWLAVGMADLWPIGREGRPQPGVLARRGLRAPEGLRDAAAAAWDVGALLLALQEAAAAHPRWVVRSYEELSREPVAAVRALFDEVGLGWDPAVEAYLEAADQPGFVVHQGTASTHPNALGAGEAGTRRATGGPQYLRRMSPEQIADARRVLERFELGAWGPGEEAAPAHG